MTAVPTPRGVASWALSMLDEVARLPWTLARARRMVVDLPDRIEDLNAALGKTTAALESMLPVLIDSVHQVDGRTERLADTLDGTKVVLEENMGVLIGAIGTIPGMRRAVRSGLNRG